MLPALAIEAQLEAQPLPAEQAQAIAQPVIAPVLGGPDAEPRRSKSRRATPDWRMMLDSVPSVSSAWSGTGTVVVVLPNRCCMTM